MLKKGYIINDDYNRKYPTIRSINDKKAVRMYQLGEKYLPKNIAERVFQNPCYVQEEYYKLIDSFCWFWLHFKEGKKIVQQDFWQQHLKESDIASWRGIAFEEVCLQHITQIKYSLHIAGVSSQESSCLSLLL